MVALNFKKQFAEAVRSGVKRQTVRREGKRKLIITGTKLQLYTGQRTKDCVKLGDAVCTGTSAVYLDCMISGRCPSRRMPLPRRDEKNTSSPAQDGFKDEIEMLEFFDRAGLTFDGWVIYWDLVDG